MKLFSTSIGLTVLAGVIFSQSISATVTIDYVTVGNIDNSTDQNNHYGCGSVAYVYKIGTYEVTNAQYAEFLNAKGASNDHDIFNAEMESYGITRSGSVGSFTYNVTSGFENKPVVYVSWFDAARFANWLGNGQGNGDTETGAYTLNGAMSGIFTLNQGAPVYIPSENEWYKAAYYNPDTDSYSLYPTQSDTITQENANFGAPSGPSTDVGSFSNDPSFYGTFDQGGNVMEWNDSIIIVGDFEARGLRGGAWGSNAVDLRSSSSFSNVPTYEQSYIGFRVASSAIPEPGSIFAVGCLISSGLLFRSRQKVETSRLKLPY